MYWRRVWRGRGRSFIGGRQLSLWFAPGQGASYATGAMRARPALVIALVTASGCLFGHGPTLDPYVDDAGPPDGTSLGDDANAKFDVDLGPPFAIAGLQPSHGPWSGGTRTTIAGRGFSSKVHVWIGGAPLDPSAVFASTPTHIAV